MYRNVLYQYTAYTYKYNIDGPILDVLVIEKNYSRKVSILAQLQACFQDRLAACQSLPDCAKHLELLWSQGQKRLHLRRFGPAHSRARGFLLSLARNPPSPVAQSAVSLQATSVWDAISNPRLSAFCFENGLHQPTHHHLMCSHCSVRALALVVAPCCVTPEGQYKERVYCCLPLHSARLPSDLLEYLNSQVSAGYLKKTTSHLLLSNELWSALQP